MKLKKYLVRSKERGTSLFVMQGFTLIEVMITAFILAVGLLGVAGMQVVGVKETQNSYFRTQADMLVRDLAEKMKANRYGAKPDTEIYVQSPLNGYRFDGIPGSAVDCSNDCNASTMVSYDLYQWSQAIINSGLPNGVGTVVWNDPIYTVTVFWEEDRGSGATGRGCDPSNASDMACARLTLEL